jgi:hypothetical protein
MRRGTRPAAEILGGTQDQEHEQRRVCTACRQESGDRHEAGGVDEGVQTRDVHKIDRAAGQEA